MSSVELKIGLVPYSPLGKGFLSGTIDATTPFADSDFRGQTPRFQDEALSANLALVEVLNKIAAETGATPAQLALTWLLHNNHVSCPSREPSASPDRKRTWVRQLLS